MKISKVIYISVFYFITAVTLNAENLKTAFYGMYLQYEGLPPGYDNNSNTRVEDVFSAWKLCEFIHFRECEYGGKGYKVALQFFNKYGAKIDVNRMNSLHYAMTDPYQDIGIVFPFAGYVKKRLSKTSAIFIASIGNRQVVINGLPTTSSYQEGRGFLGFVRHGGEHKLNDNIVPKADFVYTLIPFDE